MCPPAENWYSILHNGFDAGRGRVESLYGDGIYFASQPSVACEFAGFSATWTRRCTRVANALACRAHAHAHTHAYLCNSRFAKSARVVGACEIARHPDVRGGTTSNRGDRRDHDVPDNYWVSVAERAVATMH